ncbi:MAG TPA: hypothetical protein VFX17_04205 [Patescibacteria group bacterium]|nr:hypothetical protein [Patescibacteria group bacterium]
MNKVVLIGGSPTAGKTHTAGILAKELDVPWISTDMIREQMRWIVRKEDYPNLFLHGDPGVSIGADIAVEFLNNNTPDQIVAHQNKESEDVWKGVRSFVEVNYFWGDFIIEGVAILPHLIANQGWKSEVDIRSIFLIDEDKDRVRNTVFTRGLWDEASKYPDNVKEKEVEWVFAFNEMIKMEARKYNMPVISVDRSDYINKIKELIK